MTEQRALQETVSTLKMMISTYEKKATPRCPFKAMRYSLGLAVQCVEKQIPMKAKVYIGNDVSCPSCNKRLRGYDGMKIAYCKFCGQLIKGEGVIDDWEDPGEVGRRKKNRISYT